MNIVCQLVFGRIYSPFHEREFSHVSPNNDSASKRWTGGLLSAVLDSASTKCCENHLIQIVGEYRIAISKQYSLPILVRKKNAPSVRLLVSIMTCNPNKKRSTGVLANQVARVVLPTLFHGTLVIWGHFGVLCSWRRSIFFTLSSVCYRRSPIPAPFLAFLGQLPPSCLSSSWSHTLWNTIPSLLLTSPFLPD